MDDSRLTKKIFNYDYNVNGKWCKSVKSILKKTNMLDTYNNKEKCDIKLCRENLLSLFINKWQKDIVKKPKLRTYCTFKTEFYTETYVTMNLSHQERSIISQFRLGTLPLEIELGRFINKKVEDRICRCKNGVEDEIHFLFDCNLYDDIRDVFFKDVNINTTEDKNMIIKKLCVEHPRQFAKYLLKAMDGRKL